MSEQPSVGTAEGRLPEARLREAIAAFLEDCSIDTTPLAAAEADAYPGVVPRGMRIYVGQPPGTPLEEITALVVRLDGMGFHAIPQFAVRELDNETQLRTALERYRRLGIDEALVVAGDRAEPAGPYASTLELLGTGLLADHGITTIGVAGYPEGNRLIGPTVLREALAAKADLAGACGWQMYIVTQLGFDPVPVIEWVDQIRTDGIDLPVHVGLPGIGPLRELIGYAQRCGVGASMRMLVGKATSMSDSIKLTTTGELVAGFARHRALNPECGIAKARFFTFAGVESTMRWIEAVRAGAYRLSAEARQLELESF